MTDDGGRTHIAVCEAWSLGTGLGLCGFIPGLLVRAYWLGLFEDQNFFVFKIFVFFAFSG